MTQDPVDIEQICRCMGAVTTTDAEQARRELGLTPEQVDEWSREALEEINRDRPSLFQRYVIDPLKRLYSAYRRS